ncbi:MAG: hypothetical protein RLZZ324_1245 [Candidatus Parcubacteria bacterium]
MRNPHSHRRPAPAESWARKDHAFVAIILTAFALGALIGWFVSSASKAHAQDVRPAQRAAAATCPQGTIRLLVVPFISQSAARSLDAYSFGIAAEIAEAFEGDPCVKAVTGPMVLTAEATAPFTAAGKPKNTSGFIDALREAGVAIKADYVLGGTFSGQTWKWHMKTYLIPVVPKGGVVGTYYEDRANPTVSLMRTFTTATAKAMGGSFSQAIAEYFLCTTVAMFAGPEGAEFAAIGDGDVIVNGEHHTLGPFPGNEPPYLAYALVSTSLSNQDPALLRFRTVRTLAAGELAHFAIGSDGLRDLIAVADKTFPGTENVIGPVSQLWENDKFFRNKDAIRRLLAMVNTEKSKVDWQKRELTVATGHLKDDTAVVVGRLAKAVAP